MTAVSFQLFLLLGSFGDALLLVEELDVGGFPEDALCRIQAEQQLLGLDLEQWTRVIAPVLGADAERGPATKRACHRLHL